MIILHNHDMMEELLETIERWESLKTKPNNKTEQILPHFVDDISILTNLSSILSRVDEIKRERDELCSIIQSSHKGYDRNCSQMYPKGPSSYSRDSVARTVEKTGRNKR